MTIQLAPKFKVEQTFELPDALQSLGMIQAFDRDALILAPWRRWRNFGLTR